MNLFLKGKFSFTETQRLCKTSLYIVGFNLVYICWISLKQSNPILLTINILTKGIMSVYIASIDHFDLVFFRGQCSMSVLPIMLL